MIQRYSIPATPGVEHVVQTADGVRAQGRIVAVAASPDADGQLPIWVETTPWPLHDLIVLVVRDCDPIPTTTVRGHVRELVDWQHAGTTNTDPLIWLDPLDEADLGVISQPLHVLYHRRRRTEDGS